MFMPRLHKSESSILRMFGNYDKWHMGNPPAPSVLSCAAEHRIFRRTALKDIRSKQIKQIGKQWSFSHWFLARCPPIKVDKNLLSRIYHLDHTNTIPSSEEKVIAFTDGPHMACLHKVVSFQRQVVLGITSRGTSRSSSDQKYLTRRNST